MSARDPANADYYAANYAAFAAMIDELDAAMRTSFATVPVRQLLTYHDAYAYFAEDYDWKVIGAIQVSDFEDPTPGEVADLIEQVRAEGVPAIFGSEVFPSPVLEQIGEETGVDVRRRAARRRPARRAGRCRALVARADAVRLHHDDRGARRRRVRAARRSRCATSPPTRRTTRNERSPRPRSTRPSSIRAATASPARTDTTRCSSTSTSTSTPTQFIGIVGPSGSGKTTLLRVLLGTVDPVAGHRSPAPGLRVGYVPQVETVELELPGHRRRVRADGPHAGRSLPWRSRGRAARDRRGARAARHRRARPTATSASCRAASSSGCSSPGPCSAIPHLLLMDEPTSGVDVRTRHEVLHLLDDLHDDGHWPSCSPPTTSTASPPTCPTSCASTPRSIGAGAPRDVLTPDVLERTYGARMEVLEHAGMPIVRRPVPPAAPRRGAACAEASVT